MVADRSVQLPTGSAKMTSARARESRSGNADELGEAATKAAAGYFARFKNA